MSGVPERTAFPSKNSEWYEKRYCGTHRHSDLNRRSITLPPLQQPLQKPPRRLFPHPNLPDLFRAVPRPIRGGMQHPLPFLGVTPWYGGYGRAGIEWKKDEG